MAHQKRAVQGSVGSGRGQGRKGKASTAAGTDNRKAAKYWVSHRKGPFMVHDNAKDCEQQPSDSVGYMDDKEFAIEQGFMPCPKCMS